MTHLSPDSDINPVRNYIAGGLLVSKLYLLYTALSYHIGRRLQVTEVYCIEGRVDVGVCWCV